MSSNYLLTLFLVHGLRLRNIIFFHALPLSAFCMKCSFSGTVYLVFAIMKHPLYRAQDVQIRYLDLLLEDPHPTLSYVSACLIV